MESTPLFYNPLGDGGNSRKMRWTPVRILAIGSHGPLSADEPADLYPREICRMLEESYSVFVQLEPGDGTCYGLVLSGRPGNGPGRPGVIVAVRVGAWTGSAIVVPIGKRIPGGFVTVEFASNPWTAEFLAWWISELSEHGAALTADL